MKVRGQGSFVLLAVMSVAIIFVTIIGATFAYFSVNLQKTGTEKKVDIRSKALVIEFKSTNNIYYKHILPGRPVWEEDEKPTNILKFTITSPTDMLARNAYDVYLNIDKNQFITDNIVYIVKENECFRKDGSGSTLGEMYAEQKTLYKLYDDPQSKNPQVLEEFEVGTIPGQFTGKLRISQGAILGGLGCVDEWEVEVWLNEIAKEQNEDQGKILHATVEIETSTIYPIELKHDNGNDNQDNNGNNNHVDGKEDEEDQEQDEEDDKKDKDNNKDKEEN